MVKEVQNFHVVRLSPLGTVATVWPVVPSPNDRWWLWNNQLNVNWQGKLKYLEKTCPIATLSTTNPTWPDPGSNLGRHGGKLVTNRLSPSEALYVASLLCLLFPDMTSFLGCAHCLLDLQQELVDTWHVTLVSLPSVLSGYSTECTNLKCTLRALDKRLRSTTPEISEWKHAWRSDDHTTHMLCLIKYTHWLLNFFLLPPTPSECLPIFLLMRRNMCTSLVFPGH
jgi:hypothetical protein